MDNKVPWNVFRDTYLNSKRSFLDVLANYEVDQVSDETLKKLEAFIKKPTLNLDFISRKSSAFAKLVEYVMKMVELCKILKGKKPKDKALRDIQMALKQAQLKLQQFKDKISRLEMETSSIVSKLDEANARKKEAQNEADQTLDVLNLANRLINGIMSENSRWNEKIEILNRQKETFSTDYLLTSIFLTYAGGFTKKFRVELMRVKIVSCLQIFKVIFLKLTSSLVH